MSRIKEECKICQIVADMGNPLRITELEVSVIGLSRDQYFRGYTLVTYKWHVTELYHLPHDERTLFCEEMIKVAKALDEALHPDKMNYALLGNVSAHLHWHVIPRYKNDGFWGRPIWVHRHEEKRLAKEEYLELRDKIGKHLR